MRCRARVGRGDIDATELGVIEREARRAATPTERSAARRLHVEALVGGTRRLRTRRALAGRIRARRFVSSLEHATSPRSAHVRRAKARIEVGLGAVAHRVNPRRPPPIVRARDLADRVAPSRARHVLGDELLDLGEGLRQRRLHHELERFRDASRKREDLSHRDGHQDGAIRRLVLKPDLDPPSNVVR